jgi:uncharacterized RDD family membrane protein YckC
MSGGDSPGFTAPGAARPSDTARPSNSTLISYTPLVGGEAVPIDLRVARLGSRLIAALLDWTGQFFVLLFIEAWIVRLPLDTAATQALFVLVLVLVLIGYPVGMETAWGGRTLGKAAMGLRATRDDGGPLRFRHALVRGLFRVFVDGPVTLGIAGALSMLFSERSKRLGDMAAGTVVLQDRVPNMGGYLPPMPPPLTAWAATLDLSRFADALALSCRQFLGRVDQLSDEARERIGASLVASVQAVVFPPPPPGTPGWAYLSAVLAERRRREELRMGWMPTGGGPVPAAPPSPPPIAPSLQKQPAEAPPTSGPPDRGFALPG